MTLVRRAAYAALSVSLVHVVFGAIVRISGSGMGCGDNWPKCYGYWFPPFTRMDLVIEVMHRYLAVLLFVAIAGLLAAAWTRRSEPGVSGRGGVLRVAGVAAGLWFAPALFGAVTVFLGNPAWATVVHKLLAASLLAVLLVAVVRAGGFGAPSVAAGTGTRKAIGGASAAAGLALLVIVMGGLTAKVPDAAIACRGFPLCGEGSLGGGAQHVQLTHRVLAYLLVAHLVALPVLFRRRGEARAVRAAALVGAGFGLLQVAWAAWMVLGGFPGVIRSLHQATGIAIWVTAVAMVLLARRAAPQSTAAPARRGALDLRGATSTAS
jgi:heme A synthase